MKLSIPTPPRPMSFERRCLLKILHELRIYHPRLAVAVRVNLHDLAKNLPRGRTFEVNTARSAIFAGFMRPGTVTFRSATRAARRRLLDHVLLEAGYEPATEGGAL